jgi:hypothetical protein
MTAATSASAQQVRTIGRISDASSVRQWAGEAIVSPYDASSDSFSLRLVALDGRSRRLPIAPAPGRPLDADIGPGPDGLPTVVYERDGDLWMLRVGDRRGHPIAGANTADMASSPTIWHDRIAFVQEHDGHYRVYTRGLHWPARRPSKRLPASRDDQISARHLELHGHTLALVTGRPGNEDGVDEIRIDDTRDRATRVIDELGLTGLGGYALTDLSFANGWLGWAVTCEADPGGCYGSTGAHRYRYREGPRYDRLEFAQGRYVPLSGFSLTPRGSLQVIARGERGLDRSSRLNPCDPTDPNRPCPLIHTSPLQWQKEPR